MFSKSKKGEKASETRVLAGMNVNSSTALESVLDYFIHNQGGLLTRLQEDKLNEEIRRKVLRIAEEQFLIRNIKGNELKKCVQNFERYIWGYYVLDELITDRTISDIKCYAFNHVRIKRFGKRSTADVSFENAADFRRFVSMVAVRNQVNISSLNSVQSFVDEESSSDFYLRCDICTEYINESKTPMLQIRKSPKFKYSFEELCNKGFMTPEQAKYLQEKIESASGIFVTGKGSAGKTTLINAMIEYLPHTKSALCIQALKELFSLTHPDILFQRTRLNSGESRVSYGLKELATNGLVLDIDYFILSEIKGPEAADFAQASFTGNQCWASGHGQNEKDGIFKLADNVKRATGYELPECLRLLTGMEVVVFMKDYQIAGISEIKGYDEKSGNLIFEKIDLPLPAKRE